MKIKKQYFFFIAIAAILISSYAIYSYVYKEHRNIAEEKVDYKMSVQQLGNTMRTSDTAEALIDKVIQTNGIITAIEQNSVTLNDMVQVDFDQDYMNQLSQKSTITIKGRCVGYDDLLELVKIDQATIIKNRPNK